MPSESVPRSSKCHCSASRHCFASPRPRLSAAPSFVFPRPDW
jgi:hypothetical protein